MNPKKLLDERVKAGLTQKQLAEKTGLTDITISNIETGKVNPFPLTIGKIARALGIDPKELQE